MFPDRRAFERMFLQRKSSRVIHRRERICKTKLLSPGASEKIIFLEQLTVPTTDTGALAEKAKMCRIKSIEGIRQVSPVASA